jgi:glycosyltransferase involved in cell wall biosynthesis
LNTSEPASVVRLITRLNIGGPSIQAIHLTRALEPSGFHTRLVYGALDAGEGDMRYLLDPAADVEYVPALRRPVAPADDARAFARILRILLGTKPALLHTHMAKAGALGRLAAIAYKRIARRPLRVVHTYHGHVLDGYFSPRKTEAVLSVERTLAKATDALVAISDTIERELIDEYRIGHPSQYRVIPLGFDLEPFAALDGSSRRAARQAFELDPAAPVLTTVGRLTAIKHHELLLDAAAQILRARPDAQFLIVGDGDRREALEARAVELGIAASLRFTGWRRDLPAVYAASDVFLLTSRNEGTPVALIEAMASAVPGVATAVGGVPDVIVTPDLGTLVAPDDAAALARAAIELVTDPDRRRAIGSRARAHVLGRYRQERLVADIAALYRELLPGR